MVTVKIVSIGDVMTLKYDTEFEKAIKLYKNLKSIINGTMQLLDTELNETRMQYKAIPIVKRLSSHSNTDAMVIGITLKDLYIEGLNFVFGLAISYLRSAVVSLYRLKEGEENTVKSRIVKEVAHELGHLLHLEHCDNKQCLMSFSNSLAEVDVKQAWLCDKCRYKLE